MIRCRVSITVFPDINFDAVQWYGSRFLKGRCSLHISHFAVLPPPIATAFGNDCLGIQGSHFAAFFRFQANRDVFGAVPA